MMLLETLKWVNILKRKLEYFVGCFLVISKFASKELTKSLR